MPNLGVRLQDMVGTAQRWCGRIFHPWRMVKVCSTPWCDRRRSELVRHGACSAIESRRCTMRDDKAAGGSASAARAGRVLRYVPIVGVLGRYDRKWLRGDLIAGV